MNFDERKEGRIFVTLTLLSEAEVRWFGYQSNAHREVTHWSIATHSKAVSVPVGVTLEVTQEQNKSKLCFLLFTEERKKVLTETRREWIRFSLDQLQEQLVQLTTTRSLLGVSIRMIGYLIKKKSSRDREERERERERKARLMLQTFLIKSVIHFVLGLSDSCS